MEKTFEEAIIELEKIVNDMDNSDMSLDDSMKNFSYGMELSKHCYKLLDEAEKKIVTILEKDGEIISEEM